MLIKIAPYVKILDNRISAIQNSNDSMDLDEDINDFINKNDISI